MAYYNDKAKVKTGVETRSQFNLSYKVVCTQEISRLQPICKRLLVPGDKISVKPGSFHRLAPLPVPTYGNLKNVTRAFFVPLRILMAGYQEFMSRIPYVTEDGPIPAWIPFTRNSVIVEMLSTPSYGFVNPAPDGVYDFNINNTNYVFTYKGKCLVNLLYSLGIRLNYTLSDTTEINILPLMAYARIYLDWYLPTQYYTQDPLHAYFKNPQLALISGVQLYDFCQNIRFFEALEKDLFSNAWPNSYGPNGAFPAIINSPDFGSASGGAPNDLTIDNEDARVGIYATSSKSITWLTQYGLDTLKALNNYLNRSMVAGNRYIEQLFARYGVKVPDAWLQRSEYLGSNTEAIQISDVMATASTGNAGSPSLGDYAGKGIGYNQSHFSYEAKEFGYFIVLNCIIAETGYVQGRDKDVLYTDALQFFTPEFDQLGTSPIRNDEIFTGFRSQSEYAAAQQYGGKPDGIFGFAEQYYEYKNSRDYLLGDFAFTSRNTNMGSYHLFRQIQRPLAAKPLALNLEFMSGDPSADYNNFNRIFQNSGNQFDHFMSEHHLQVSASRPMHGRAEALVTEGGREMEMEFNGIRM